MVENNYCLEQLLLENSQVTQLQKAEHQVQQNNLTIKYNILIERNQLDTKHLKQFQLLETLHIHEMFNMRLKQVLTTNQLLILNQVQRDQLIECQQLEQNQLKQYQKFEQALMFKNNNLTNRLKKYFKSDSEIKLIYQKIEKIKLQKEEVIQNIILFFQKKNFELNLISL